MVKKKKNRSTWKINGINANLLECLCFVVDAMAPREKYALSLFYINNQQIVYELCQSFLSLSLPVSLLIFAFGSEIILGFFRAQAWF